ncbi:hypothetical protein RM780_16170 [Streptomyces sp. DSM 44917]|uniref:Uncharacterized protein n=1 Tax=Streptomyces boetiae TaxID=3075541 RepID=A0ABU2LAX2_9ACTN|nr:hypothetical protein [Streptomyces sp. DSM 44917]MDT0308482.1 hypothetical protein [Streptomyces sp. DSM 44917]
MNGVRPALAIGATRPGLSAPVGEGWSTATHGREERVPASAIPQLPYRASPKRVGSVGVAVLDDAVRRNANGFRAIRADEGEPPVKDENDDPVPQAPADFMTGAIQSMNETLFRIGDVSDEDIAAMEKQTAAIQAQAQLMKAAAELAEADAALSRVTRGDDDPSECPDGLRHTLPPGVGAMIAGDEKGVAEAAAAAAHSGCPACRRAWTERVRQGDDTPLILVSACWLLAHAQIHAQRDGLIPVTAEDLFEPDVFEQLRSGTRSFLRDLFLSDTTDLPDGRTVHQPGPDDLVPAIQLAEDRDRMAVWQDAWDGIAGITMTEAMREPGF